MREVLTFGRITRTPVGVSAGFSLDVTCSLCRGAAGRAPRGRHPGAGVEEQRAPEGVRPGELQGAGVRRGPGFPERDGQSGTLHPGAVPQPVHQAGGAGTRGGMVGF